MIRSLANDRAPACSTSVSGSYSIWSITSVVSSSMRWNVTTPAFLAPVRLVHAMR